MLLDTNVVLRLADASRPLPEALIDQISRAEIGVKFSVGKLALGMDEARFWNRTQDLLQAEKLAFSSDHASRLHALPLHHRDPFDRMILAQALAEDLPVATTDAIFARYGVRLLAES